MMEPVESRNQSPEQSPNFFESPKSPEGIRRINWRLLGAVGGLLVLLFGIPVAYTYYDRFNPDHGSGGGDKEPITIQDAGPSPVKQPAEVVSYKPPLPVPVDSSGLVPTGLTEAERRAQEKKIADFEAARNASPRVENTAAKQQQPRQQNAPMMPPPPSAGGFVPPSPPMQADSQYGYEADANRQEQKKAFLKSHEESSPYLKHTRMAPLFPAELKAGSIIPGVMISGINSDLPGQCIGQVRQNVYDSATGRHVVMPGGARLICEYDSQISAGQARVLVAWTRVIYPDGSSLSLDTMPGADKSGVAGLSDKVDNHYLRTFGQAFLLSLFTAGSQLSQTRGSPSGNFSASQILAAAVGMQGFNLGSQLIRRNLNIQPTLEIRPGMEFSIMVTKDIGLPPWRGHPLAQVEGR